ncbi:MAG: response regulator [Kiritimatiellae bacterium]|nr:response regulator [Kiritimatiellia bacterium]
MTTEEADDRREVGVLLIEDDPDDAFLASSALGASPDIYFRTTHVCTLKDGMQRAAEVKFDVVLLDLSLPDSTGLDSVTRFIEVHDDVPVVVLTGFMSAELGVQAVRLGAQEYLTKQSVGTGEALLSSVRHAIERFELLHQLRDHQDHLEDLVKLRTSALRKALDEVRARDLAKSEFVSNVSHELKTPIACLLYAIDNLLDGVKGEVSEDVRSYLQMIRRDGTRLQFTVEDILDLSSLDTGRFTLNRAPVSMDRLCRRVVHELQTTAQRKGVNMLTDCRGDAGFVMCDARKIERVVMNVVGNSLKYTPEGGGVIVGVGAGDTGSLRVTVTDSGVGIPATALAHVTDRYYRVGEHIDGSGLGLSIAKEIVELHEGEMTIQSPPPGKTRGTQVCLQLPLCESPTVLVADDDDTVLEVIRMQLERQGYHVLSSSSGYDALGVLSGTHVDVMVLDIVMPDLSGIEVIAEVKAAPHIRQLPIVVVTGYPMDEFKKEFLGNLDIPWLMKPWKPEDLLGCIEKGVRLLSGDGDERENSVALSEQEQMKSVEEQQEIPTDGSREKASVGVCSFK